MDVNQVIRILNKRYKIKPWKEKPFKVLIAAILSQRTKDEITRAACRRLFKVGDTPEKVFKLSHQKVEKLIYPVGFYREKAKKIKKICKILLEKYEGKVPSSREELLKLPGVGDKTASCVLCFGYGIPTVIVDTHCNRISQRLGLVPQGSTPQNTRKILERLISNELKFVVNFLFIRFGKEICRPIKPRCDACPVRKLCRYTE